MHGILSPANLINAGATSQEKERAGPSHPAVWDILVSLRNMVMKGMLAGMMIALFLILSSCETGDPTGRVLFDFEEESALDGLSWKCRVLYSLSPQYATHGEKSLKMELYPSEYPGVSPTLSGTDWRGYRALRLDIHNPGKEAVTMTVRIDDRKDASQYGDRYQGSFTMNPGDNPVVIPFTDLTTSGSQIPLALGNIRKLAIFTFRPKRKTVLYIDHIRLTDGSGRGAE